MFAFPSQGHITPYVNLAMKLASNGVVITFVHLEFIHHMLSSQSQPDPFFEARNSSHDIRYTTINDGFPVDYDQDDKFWELMFQTFTSRVDEFVGQLIRSGPHFAPFLVTDTLFTWQITIAEKYNLLRVSFSTGPALVFSVAYHFDILQKNGHFPCKDHVEEEIKYVPGVKSVNTKDLIPHFKESDTRTLVKKMQMKAFEEVKKADFILHNTVYELESEAISALNKIQPNYAIGPISFSKNLTDAYNTVSNRLRSESDYSEWLSTKPPDSVLYISFGSFLQANKHVVEEIAHGLLLSQVNFIWVLRADDDALPSEFKEKSKEKGMIVRWCDQIKVLSNPAVGGFLTHCGWNSVLESIWCGVPMICYPLDFDQPMNRKLVVEDWKIGINLCEGASVDREGVSEKMNKFMNAGVSESLRHEMKNVNVKMRNALESEGSSEANFDRFLKDLKAKLAANV